MWPNDYPHSADSWPGATQFIVQDLGHLMADARAKVLDGNAARYTTMATCLTLLPVRISHSADWVNRLPPPTRSRRVHRHERGRLMLACEGVQSTNAYGRPRRRKPVMSQPIRAVYKGGQLWLLDPVHLTEGQEICVLILSEEDRVRAALGDLVVPTSAPTEEDVDEEALVREVEEGFRGQPPLSETILEERREGP